MKIKILIFSMFLILLSSAYGEDEGRVSVQKDIASAKSVDDLIVKMNKANEEYRYLYMNAIKSKIIALKDDMRKKAMDKVIEKIDESEANEHAQNKEGFAANAGGMGRAEVKSGMDNAGEMGSDFGNDMSKGSNGMGGGSNGGGMGGEHGGGGGHGF